MADVRKKRKRKLRRWVVVCLWLLAVLVIAAAVYKLAASRKKKLFTVGSEKVYEDEVAFYALQMAYSYHLTDVNTLDEFYDGDTTYEVQYKKELQQQIVDTKVMYICAVKQGLRLNEKAQGEIAAQTAQTLSDIGSYLDKFKIDEALVKRVLTEQYYAELLKNTVDLEESAPETYFHTYNILFPTVRTGEDGTLLVDENGIVVAMGEEDRQKQYALAMKAVELSKTDMTIEKIAKELDVEEYAGDIYGNMDDYGSVSYVTEVKRLSDGMISDIIETEYGYNVFCLIAGDDREYAMRVQNRDDLTKWSDILNTQMERWRQEANLNESELAGDAWERFSMRDYVLY